MNVLNFFQCWPVFDACNFNQVHASHPLFKDYPQVIDTGDVEKTFLQFEVQIVFSCQGQDVMDSSSVIVVIGVGGCGYIIHVNMYGSTQKFMLSYNGAKDMIHHCLEGHRGIGEAKKHVSP